MKISNRNYGIDLLRVLSMLFVVILHFLGHGGILQNTIVNSNQYKFFWFVEIICYIAVDVFALISGYVFFTREKKNIKFSKYLNLWLQVVFYGVVICLITYFIKPSILNEKIILGVLFPVMYNSYWYFTAYTGLYFFMPIINVGIKNCDDRLLKQIFISIFVLFTIVELLNPKFILNGGYSVLWILSLYIMGAILKKTNMFYNIKNYKLILLIIALYIITYLYKIYGFEFNFLNLVIYKDSLVSYISPTILLISIFYVIIFSKINFNQFFIKIISFLAPSTFAIYIVNENSIIRDNIITNMFKDVANSSIKLTFIKVLLFSIIFVISVILIDKIRILIFKIFKVKRKTPKT